MNTPTPRQLEMLQHALGLDGCGQPPDGYRGCSDDDFPGCYRNRYVTDKQSPDGQECEKMVELGWMTRLVEQPGFIGGMTNYFVTNLGYDTVKQHSPAPKKLTRSQQRYQDFRNFDGVFADFRAYLRYLKNQKA